MSLDPRHFNTRKYNAAFLREIADDLEKHNDGQLCNVKVNISFRTIDEINKATERLAKKLGAVVVKVWKKEDLE